MCVGQCACVWVLEERQVQKSSVVKLHMSYSQIVVRSISLAFGISSNYQT